MKTINVSAEAFNSRGTMKQLRKESQELANEKGHSVEICFDGAVLEAFNPMSPETYALVLGQR